MQTARDHGPFAYVQPRFYCVLFAVSLCALSLVMAGLGLTEFDELVVAVLAVLAVSGGVEGMVATVEGAATAGVATVVVALVDGWFTDTGAGVAGLIGAAAVTGAEGVARGDGSLLVGVEALTLAALFAGAFVALLLSSRGGALPGLRLAASSTTGRASATTAGLSPFEGAVTAGPGVASATSAGGLFTSATVLSAR